MYCAGRKLLEVTKGLYKERTAWVTSNHGLSVGFKVRGILLSSKLWSKNVQSWSVEYDWMSKSYFYIWAILPVGIVEWMLNYERF